MVDAEKRIGRIVTGRDHLRMRFSSKILFGDSMLRRAAAASLVSMLSSVPETALSRDKVINMYVNIFGYSCVSLGCLNDFHFQPTFTNKKRSWSKKYKPK